MSKKERIIELLDVIPNYKMEYVLAYVQGVVAVEEADERFCRRMIGNYETHQMRTKRGMPLTGNSFQKKERKRMRL